MQASAQAVEQPLLVVSGGAEEDFPPERRSNGRPRESYWATGPSEIFAS